MEVKLAMLRSHILSVDAEHKQEIRKDPAFRKHFQVGRSKIT